MRSRGRQRGRSQVKAGDDAPSHDVDVPFSPSTDERREGSVESRKDRDDSKEEEESSKEEGEESELDASQGSYSDSEREGSVTSGRSRRASSHSSDTISNKLSPTKKGREHTEVEIKDVSFELGDIHSYEKFPNPKGDVSMCENEPSRPKEEDRIIMNRIAHHSPHTQHYIAFMTRSVYAYGIHCIHLTRLPISTYNTDYVCTSGISSFSFSKYLTRRISMEGLIVASIGTRNVRGRNRSVKSRIGGIEIVNGRRGRSGAQGTRKEAKHG